MPAAMRYLEPNSKDREALTSPILANEDKQRIEDFKEAFKYYTGDHKKHLKQKEGEPDDNVTINLVRMAVDRTGDFLFSDVPAFELDPAEMEDTPDEIWIKQVIDYNGGLAWFHKMFLNGALSKHVFLRVIAPDMIHPFPRALLLDPQTIKPFWKADDNEIVVWYEITWKVGSTDYLLDIVNQTGQVAPVPLIDQGDGTFLEGIPGWNMFQYSRTNSTKWNLEKQEFWPFVYGPIVQWPHMPLPNSFFGDGEVKDLDLQDSVNLMFSEMARINRYYASPRTVILGAEGDDIQPTGSDKMWALPKEGAEVVNLEMRSELQASQQVAMFLHDAYLATQRVVILRGEVKDFQRVTNVGVRTVFIDMLAKNKLLQAQYGAGLKKLVLTMSIISGKGQLIPTVIFKDPLPTDVLEAVNVLAIKQNNQWVSREQASTELGYNWQDQLEKMRQENKDPMFQAQQPKQQTGAQIEKTGQGSNF